MQASLSCGPAKGLSCPTIFCHSPQPLLPHTSTQAASWRKDSCGEERAGQTKERAKPPPPWQPPREKSRVMLILFPFSTVICSFPGAMAISHSHLDDCALCPSPHSRYTKARYNSTAVKRDKPIFSKVLW